ncbi:MAG: DUF4101 domain-containing protein, partial [Moorea sp. SIO2I5]|nr:DUF4101 domain-containing protein [Moorena sp. SIO2I5]
KRIDQMDRAFEARIDQLDTKSKEIIYLVMEEIEEQIKLISIELEKISKVIIDETTDSAIIITDNSSDKAQETIEVATANIQQILDETSEDLIIIIEKLENSQIVVIDRAERAAIYFVSHTANQILALLSAIMVMTFLFVASYGWGKGILKEGLPEKPVIRSLVIYLMGMTFVAAFAPLVFLDKNVRAQVLLPFSEELKDIGITGSYDSDRNPSNRGRHNTRVLEQSGGIKNYNYQKPEPPYITKIEAKKLIKKWQKIKKKVFAPPFDKYSLAQVTTGKFYREITKPNGIIESLKKNNSYYKYNYQNLNNIEVDNSGTVIIAIVSESRTKYQNYQVWQKKEDTLKVSYKLQQSGGVWKIASIDIKTISENEELVAITKEEAKKLIEKWQQVKKKVFAPPFDQDLLAQVTTGDLYRGITEPNGRIDSLKKDNAYYEYTYQSVDKIESLKLEKSCVVVTAIVSQSRTKYQNGKVSEKVTETQRRRYGLEKSDGVWKIAFQKQKKSDILSRKVETKDMIEEEIKQELERINLLLEKRIDITDKLLSN